MADAIAVSPARRRRWRGVDVAHHAGQLAGLVRAAFTQEVDQRRLFLWLPVLYGAGIVAYFTAEIEPSLWASAIPCLLSIGIAIAGRSRFGILAFGLAAATLFAGLFAATHRTSRVAAPVLAFPVTAVVVGTVESIERTQYGGRVIINVSSFEPVAESTPRRVRLTFRGGNSLVSGDNVRLKARLRPPAPPAVPGGFDFQREAYFQRLGAVGLISGGIEILPGTANGWLLRANAAIDAARNTLTERIVSVIGGSTGAIAAALVTGKRGQISESDNDAWRGAGIYHIISISGLHMALAAGLFFWTARVLLTVLPIPLLRQHAKKGAAIVAMAGTISYDIFSGHDVATERSMIMTLVMLGAILVDRPALAMRNLAISGLIVMTLRPETVLGPSFQMSFSAVAGLVTYGEIMRRRREQRADAAAGRDDRLSIRALRIAGDFTATSLIAGTATAPFQAFHFHRLNSYGLLGNAIAVPLCSIIVMPAALAGVVLYPLGLDAPAWWMMGQGIAAISAFAEQVAGLSGAVATVARFQSLTLAGLALAIAMFTLAASTLLRGAGLMLAATMLLAAAQTRRPEMIMAPDGRHVLAQTDQGLALLGRGRPIFSLQQWLPGEADARQPRDPALTSASNCDRLGCTARTRRNMDVALVLDPAAFRDDCERAGIIVTPLKAPASCAGPVQIYDRRHFDAYGATYLYRDTDSAITLETARNPRQQRPWLPNIASKEGRLQPIITDPPAIQNNTALPPAWDPQAPDMPEGIQ